MADKSNDERNMFQRIGGKTIVPYLLKLSGFDSAATNTGYPDYLDESAKKKLTKKKSKSRSKNVEGTQGFSRGGQVKGSGFKGTF